MSNETISDLLLQIKEEIRYKALSMGIPFDTEDIEHREVAGHYVVALAKTRRERMVLEDDVEVTYVDKVPTMWADYPSPHLVTCEEPTPRKWEVSIPVPKVRLRFPWLVYIVFPDGTYKTDGDAAEWLTHELRREYENGKA